MKHYAPFIYDAVGLMIAAMQKADSTDPAKYLPELQKISYNGSTGKIEFDDKGDRKNAEITIFTLKDGKVVPSRGGQGRQGDDLRGLHEDGGVTAAAAATGPRQRPHRLPLRPKRRRSKRATRTTKAAPSGAPFSLIATVGRHPDKGRRRATGSAGTDDDGLARDAWPDPSCHAPPWTRSSSSSSTAVTLGSVYAVVALGYTMVYGIIQLINFAHGEVVMIGAMVAYTVIVALAARATPLPPLAIVLIGALAAVPVCMAVGYTLERVAYRPLRTRAAPCAADHRDRPVDHPAAPRDDHLEPQSVALSADRQDGELPHHRQSGTARRSPTCRSRSSSCSWR